MEKVPWPQSASMVIRVIFALAVPNMMPVRLQQSLRWPDRAMQPLRSSNDLWVARCNPVMVCSIDWR